jgi:hypothetical protein
MHTRGLRVVVAVGMAVVSLCLFLTVLGGVGGVRAAPGDCAVPSGTYPTIQAAVSNAACTQVLVAAGTYHENVLITRSVVLHGAGAATTIIDGGGNGPVIRVRNGAAPNISGFTIIGGDATADASDPGNGGGIHIQAATAIIHDNIISGNVANTSNARAGEGGGIYAFTSTAAVRIYNNVIQANAAFSGSQPLTAGWGTAAGGGIAIEKAASAIITGNQILNNVGGRWASADVATVYGGGIVASGSPAVTINDNTIRGNVANAAQGPGSGGGIFLNLRVAILARNTIVQNTGTLSGATANGGGLGGRDLPSLTFSDNWVMTNTAGLQVVAAESPPNAWAAGGGIEINVSDSTGHQYVLQNNHFIGNVAAYTLTAEGAGAQGYAEGGGLRIGKATSVLLSGNEVRGNTAVMTMSLTGTSSDDWGGRPAGGGLYLGDIDVLTVTGNTVVGNMAARRLDVTDAGSTATGGGVAAERLGQATFEGNAILDNLAASVLALSGTDVGVGGGGLILIDSGVLMTANVISGNTGYAGNDRGYSGGMEVIGTQLALDRNLILANRNCANGNGDAGGVNMDHSVVTSTNDILARNYKAFNAHADSRLTLVNDTLYNNTRSGDGIGVGVRERSTALVSNTIIAGHSVGLDLDNADPPVVLVEDYNLLKNTTNYQGSVTTGTHTILNQDPKFVNAAKDDFHLLLSSPAIDKASAAWAPAVDFYGTTRPQGPKPDIGAAEYTYARVYMPVIKKQ